MKGTTYYSFLDSPIGRLLLVAEGTTLIGLYMSPHTGVDGPRPEWREEDAPLKEARRQLEEYFAGERKTFDLPLELAGTPFQRRVWQELTRIPLGETISYGELARRVGQPKAARAVGSANGKNPISIVVPCHRVIGSGGTLTGYGGGLDRKRWLLEHERQRGGLFAAQSTASSLSRAPNSALTSGRS